MAQLNKRRLRLSGVSLERLAHRICLNMRKHNEVIFSLVLTDKEIAQFHYFSKRVLLFEALFRFLAQEFRVEGFYRLEDNQSKMFGCFHPNLKNVFAKLDSGYASRQVTIDLTTLRVLTKSEEKERAAFQYEVFSDRKTWVILQYANLGSEFRDYCAQIACSFGPARG